MQQILSTVWVVVQQVQFLPSVCTFHLQIHFIQTATFPRSLHRLNLHREKQRPKERENTHNVFFHSAIIRVKRSSIRSTDFLPEVTVRNCLSLSLCLQLYSSLWIWLFTFFPYFSHFPFIQLLARWAQDFFRPFLFSSTFARYSE